MTAKKKSLKTATPYSSGSGIAQTSSRNWKLVKHIPLKYMDIVFLFFLGLETSTHLRFSISSNVSPPQVALEQLAESTIFQYHNKNKSLQVKLFNDL